MMKFTNYLLTAITLSSLIYAGDSQAQLNTMSRAELTYENGFATKNPGCQSGTVGYTASGGTLSLDSTGPAIVPNGGSFCEWDSTASSQTVSSELGSVPKTGNCEIGVWVAVPSGTATHTIHASDGTNNLTQPRQITGTADAFFERVNFPCPSGGQAKWVITSVASNEPKIAWDNTRGGRATNVFDTTVSTPIQSYSPTFNSTTGHAASNGWWYRDGANIVVGGSILFNGTGAASTFTASLPSVCTIDTSKLNDSTVASLRNRAGNWSWYDDSGSLSINPQWVKPASTTTLMLVDGSNAVVSNIFANNDRISWTAQFPCVGWQPSTAVTADNQRVPKVTVYKSGSGTFSRSSPAVTYLEVRTCYGGSANTTFGSITTSAGCDVTIIPSPVAATYSYAVGSGGSGSIEVTEYFGLVSALLANSVISRDNPGVTTVNTYKNAGDANYTAMVDDETILITPTVARTLSLPPAASVRGKKFHVMVGGSTARLTIDPNSSETVCGLSTIALFGNQDSVTIQSTGTAWIALNDGCTRVVQGSFLCSSPSSILANPRSVFSSVTNISSGACTVQIPSAMFSTVICDASWNGNGSASSVYSTITGTTITFGAPSSSSWGANVTCTGLR